MPHSSQITQDMRECMALCMECHTTCLETATHCLMMGGDHASPEHQRLLQDCAQACVVHADFMARISEYHHDLSDVCAAICKACAEDCERLAGEDETMRRCADVCRRCQQSCEQMARATV